jgi:hypothetical protein
MPLLPRRTAITLLIGVALMSIYLLTYSANLIANDELQMLDVTGSLVDYGDWQYDLAIWYPAPTRFDTTRDYPLLDTVIEPLHLIAAVPLYWLATHLPGLGIVHTAWLLNVIVCAAACALFYWYAVWRGYSDRTAVISALLLGLGTAVWVYSKMFFREPLALLGVVALMFAIDAARRAAGNGQIRRALILSLLALIAAMSVYLTKESMIAALPGLLLLIVPERVWAWRWVRVLSLIALVALIAVPLLMAFTPAIHSLIPSDRFMIGKYPVDTTYTREAIASYLFTPGASLWGSSPVLLLAIPGAWTLWRGGDRRTVLACLSAMLGVALAYALLRGSAWFGGKSWPPRFLIPALPLLMVLTLPAIDRVINAGSGRLARAGFAALIVYSVWWQISGVALSWDAYPTALPAEANGIIHWPPTHYDPRYLRPVIITRLILEGEPLDFAWARMNLWAWPLAFGALALISVWVLGRGMRAYADEALEARREPYRWIAAGGVIALLALTYVALRSLYEDPRYRGDDDSLRDLLARIDAEEQPGDVVILSDFTYADFFLNYAALDHARIIALFPHPGERGSFEQPLEVVSDVPDDLLSPASIPLIEALASTRERLWLVIETGPFLPWAIRPVERYLTLRHYPLRELNADPPDPAVRLLEYDTTRAPDPFSDPEADIAADLIYDDAIALDGITLAAGAEFAPGDSLPVTLFWSARAEIDADASVAIFLTTPEGAVVVQGSDSGPQAGFSPTSGWQSGEITLDNRAIRLPADLPPGEYTLWLRLYRFTPGGAIETLPVSGTQTAGADIGVLPVSITIR